MIPIWEVVTNPLHAPFQQLSSYVGTSILHLVGIPVRREGVLVHLPNVTLEVAEVCSGVDFLVAIVAVGVPQAYLSLRSPARRVLAVTLGAILALASNGLRVALIGWLAYYGLSGPDIHGPGHSLQGMFVAVVGFIALFVVVHLLARGERHADRPRPSTIAPPVETTGRNHLSRASVIVLVGLMLAVAAFVMTRTPAAVEPVHALSTFPEDLEQWRGGPVMAPPTYFTNNGADQQVSRVYYGPLNRSVHVYVGYFTRQQQGKELVDYRTTDLQRGASRVRIPLGSAEFEANETVVRTGNRTQYLVYWYDVNGRVTASPYQAMVWTIWDSIVSNRSNGAVIMLASDLASPTEREGVASEIQGLARLSAQQLTGILPR
jgi:EpsI family protein